MQFIHEQVFGIIEMKLRRAHRVDGVEGRHAMVGLVPPLVPLAGIDRENRIRPILPDDFGDLTTEHFRRNVFQLAVIVSQPDNILRGNAQDSAGGFFFGLADAGKAL